VTIVYAREQDLPANDFAAVLGAAGMGQNRPVADEPRLRQMLENANLIVTARDHGRIVGAARCMTDFAWVCYCAEIAVDKRAQGGGIGRAIIEHCRSILGDGVSFVLAAYPDAVGFYERIGMTRIADAFVFNRERGV
jgi:ribosomal protein S18 acetylase RimI-like enzyme